MSWLTYGQFSLPKMYLFSLFSLSVLTSGFLNFFLNDFHFFLYISILKIIFSFFLAGPTYCLLVFQSTSFSLDKPKNDAQALSCTLYI